LVPNVPLSQQNPIHMVKMRSLEPVPAWIQIIGRVLRSIYSAFSGRAQPPVPEYRVSEGEGLPWAQFWPLSAPKLIFGHDAKRRLQQYGGATGIDTGCLYGNGMTAVLFPGGVLHHVKSKRAYVLPGRKYEAPQD
jgi:hypothetical protein